MHSRVVDIEFYGVLHHCIIMLLLLLLLLLLGTDDSELCSQLYAENDKQGLSNV